MNLDFFRSESRFSVAIRDPVWKHIWFTPELLELTRSAPFLRLYRIKQLGPTEFVYPGATHTRASHSIGVYHVASRILRVLLARGADEWATATGCNSFLVAALLHDLGHFPFTHSLKDLPLLDHETLTANIMLAEPVRTLIGAAGGDPDMAAAIVSHAMVLNGKADTETTFFRNLLSGVLDPDKLDYLNRDAYYCGVPYGIQDTDFIISHINPDKERGIVINSHAILSIESILFSKYLMYRSVYWNKHVRIATAMMKKSVFTALEHHLISPEDLYKQDDSGLYALIASLDYPEKEITEAIRNRQFYQIAFEYPFNSAYIDLSRLENLSARKEAETHIASHFSRITRQNIESFHVLIDIPEQISFESNLFIPDEGKIFSSSSTVFSEDTVKKFTSSLRMARIAFHPSIFKMVEHIPDLGLELAKCLEVSYTEL